MTELYRITGIVKSFGIHRDLASKLGTELLALEQSILAKRDEENDSLVGLLEMRIEQLEDQSAMQANAAESVCKSLEHPTESVSALQMWKLRDALNATAEDVAKWQAEKKVEIEKSFIKRLRGIPSIGLSERQFGELLKCVEV